MGKKKKSTIDKKKVENNKPLINFKMNDKSLHLSLFFVLFILLIIYYKPISIDRLDPAGSDIRKNIGETSQYIHWENESGKVALWNPNIFLGIPIYFNINAKSINLDVIIDNLDDLFLDWVISWLLLGAIGMFLLSKILGFQWYISAMGSLAFIFWPHMQGLIHVGHNMKIRAICAIPLVLWSFIKYVRKRDIISFLIFTLSLSLQIRTKHYQVIFYNLLILLFVGVYYIIIWIKAKEYQRLGKTLVLFILALIVSILTAAQPLFVTKEYTPYSTRGGNEINIDTIDNDLDEKKSGGVTFDYATEWSLSPVEMITFISPRFFGGTTQEPYYGNKYPELKSHNIATYWGKMHFTMTTEYIGVLIVILAIFGIWTNRKNGFVMSFAVLALFSLFLAFGKHFPILYKLFFYYVPYFDKFRAPVMTVILFNFLFVILAMYGFQSLLKIDSLEKHKPLFIIAGIIVLIGLVFVIAPNLLSFEGLDDTQNAGNSKSIQILKNIRKDIMIQDNVRMLMFVFSFIGLVVLNYLKKIPKSLVIAGVILLISFDCISVSHRYTQKMKLYNAKIAERKYFPKTKFDLTFEKESEKFRIIELGKKMFTNGMAFRYQAMAGYSAIKPQLIQDIFDNNFNHSNDPNVNLNLPIMDMCNVKYLVSPVVIKYDNLKFLSFNKREKTGLYLNKKCLPRAFFVEEIVKLPNEEEVVKYLNSDGFDPSKHAIASSNLISNKSYVGKGDIDISNYNPNEIAFKVSCDNESFLVLSEAYYPVGWTCLIDGSNTDIHQVNHILRGIEVPGGEHDIVFKFEPMSYKTANMISNVSTYSVWILLLVLLIIKNKSQLHGILKKKSGK